MAFEAYQFICRHGSMPIDMMGLRVGGWDIVVSVALFASVAVLVLLYLSATLFRNEKAIAFVKLELYELVASALIVVLIIAWINGMCAFNLGYIFNEQQIQQFNPDLNTNSSFYETSYAYIDSVTARLKFVMFVDMAGAIAADLAGSTKIIAKPVGQGFQGSPFAGAGMSFKQMLTSGMVATVIAYSVNVSQKAILEYVLIAFPMYFLPFGLIFRSFSPTRRFGGTLLALCISFLILYPILLGISYYTSILTFRFFGDLGSTAADTASQVFQSTGKGIEEGFYGAGGPELTKDQTKGISDSIVSNYNLGITDLLGKILTLSISATDIPVILAANIFGPVFTLVYTFFFPWIAYVALVGFVLPALYTMVMVYSMKSFGRALGDEVDITSLTRVI